MSGSTEDRQRARDGEALTHDPELAEEQFDQDYQPQGDVALRIRQMGDLEEREGALAEARAIAEQDAQWSSPSDRNKGKGVSTIRKDSAQWAFIRQTLHQMRLSRMPLDQIAKRFDVSVRTISKWLNRIKEEMREEGMDLQPRDLAMQSYEALQEAKATAWREYLTAVPNQQAGYTKSQASKDRQAFLQTAIRIERELLQLGQLTGLFNEPAFKPGLYETDQEKGGHNAIQDMAKSFLELANAAKEESGHTTRNLTHEDRIVDDHDSFGMEHATDTDDVEGSVDDRVGDPSDFGVEDAQYVDVEASPEPAGEATGAPKVVVPRRRPPPPREGTTAPVQEADTSTDPDDDPTEYD